MKRSSLLGDQETFLLVCFSFQTASSSDLQNMMIAQLYLLVVCLVGVGEGHPGPCILNPEV